MAGREARPLCGGEDIPRFFCLYIFVPTCFILPILSFCYVFHICLFTWVKIYMNTSIKPFSFCQWTIPCLYFIIILCMLKPHKILVVDLCTHTHCWYKSRITCKSGCFVEKALWDEKVVVTLHCQKENDNSF